MHRAVAAAPRDATVLVRAGRYEDLSVAGRAGRPLVVRAAPGEHPRVDGLNVIASRDVRVEGLRITDIARVEASYDIAVVGNELTPHGFLVTGGADLRFERNAIHDLTIDIPRRGTPGPRCNRQSRDAGLAPHCGYAFRINATSRVLVKGNRIEGIPAHGVQLAGTADVTLEGNRFERIHAFVDPKEHSDAIQMVGGNRGTRIVDNVFVDTRGIIAHPQAGDDPQWPGAASDMVVEDNLFARMSQWAANLYDVKGLRFERNTAWDAGSAGVMLRDDDVNPQRMSGVRFVGNIVSILSAQQGMFAEQESNLIGEGLRLGPSNIAGQPRFRNPASLDYRLLPDSPFDGLGARVAAQGSAIAAAGVPASG